MGAPAKKQPPTGGAWMEEIARLVNEITGVKLGVRQSAMLEARLLKRMVQLGHTEPQAYLEYLRANRDSELEKLVGLLTTHHTFFFREYIHFEFLEEKGLPMLIEQVRKRADKTLRVWSAACSQGQEVYSLAMFLHLQLKRIAPDVKIDILGTDVDPESIAIAHNGVYRWNDLKQIPLHYLNNHWVRGTEEIAEYAKAKASIKSLCRFEVANLIDLHKQTPNEMFDLVFCRNVFIYFEPELIKRVTEGLLKRMHPHALLVIGVSESLMSTGLPVASLAPAVYVHRNSPVQVEPTPDRRNRVFCVDDSPTILGMLKRILEPEFEIVGTASNGIEAAKLIPMLKPDVVTLDIHMPEQGGIEYLEKNFSAGHPPVIILSSVPREDSAQAMRCLQLGARDYIEKPELADLATRTDEIRTKLHCAIKTAENEPPGVLEIERSFHSEVRIERPEKKLRVIFAGGADRGKLSNILRDCTGAQPPTVILMEGSAGLLPSLAEALGGTVWDGTASLEPGRVYLADFATRFSALENVTRQRPTSILILGLPTDVFGRAIASFPTNEILLEDTGVELSEVTRGRFSPTYFVPYTSMAYHSNKYLCTI